MPTYQYKCSNCDAPLEVVQSFTDDALTDCPACEDGQLKKVYGSVGVVFKGSGFYRNDSRSSGSDTGSSAPVKTSVSTDSASTSTEKTTATTSATGSSVTPAATT